MLKKLTDWLRRYADHPDPVAKAAGTIAMVVASHQPFYPLYLYAIVGQKAWPMWLTLLTTPVFAAVPAVARRHSLAGRALLPIIGIANTVLCVKLIGLKTAVEMFFFPCILLAGILFRPNERAVMIPVLLLPFAAYLFVDGRLGAPLQVFHADSYSSIVALNALSVATLMAVMGFLFAPILSQRRT